MSEHDGSQLAQRPVESSNIGDHRKRQPLFQVCPQCKVVAHQVQDLIFKMTEPEYMNRPTAEQAYYCILGIYKQSSAPMLSVRSESFQSYTACYE